MDERVFIATIKKYPLLYNKFSEDFKDAEKKELTWNDIAVLFSISVDDCKHVWRNIRERYARERRRMQITQNFSKWSLFQYLTFLNPHVRCRRPNVFKKLQNNKAIWDKANIAIHCKVEPPKFEYHCVEETHELQQTEEVVDSLAASIDTGVMESTSLAPAKSELDQLPEQLKSSDTESSCMKLYNSEHFTNSDIAFGNYIGQYLSEVSDKRKKHKLILRIIQAIHGDDDND